MRTNGRPAVTTVFARETARRLGAPGAVGVPASIARRRGSSKPACGQPGARCAARCVCAGARPRRCRAGARRVVGGEHPTFRANVGGASTAAAREASGSLAPRNSPLSVLETSVKARQVLSSSGRPPRSRHRCRAPVRSPSRGPSPSFTFTGTCPQMMREVAGSMPKSRKMPSTTASSSSSEQNGVLHLFAGRFVGDEVQLEGRHLALGEQGRARAEPQLKHAHAGLRSASSVAENAARTEASTMS